MAITHFSFVDESGDRGTRATSSNHFALGAYVIDRNHETAVRGALAQLRREFNLPSGATLHFHKLSHHKKLRTVEVLSSLPATFLVVGMCKRGISGSLISADQFYNWGARLLMERLSWYMRDTVGASGDRMSVTFAHIKGYKTAKMHDYVKVLKSQQTQIVWSRMHRPVSFDNTQVDERLQVADALASAVRYALEPEHGQVETRYLETLAPLLWRRYGKLTPYGLKMHPTTGCPESHSWVATL